MRWRVLLGFALVVGGSLAGCSKSDASDPPTLHSCDPLSADVQQSVAYAATTSDGRRFLVFEPSKGLTEDNVRVFYGTPDRVVQRKIKSISFDSSIHMEIDVDGVATLVQLDFAHQPIVFGPPRLQAPGGPAVYLTPVAGSPGDGWDRGYSDAGVDAPRADFATLVAGLQFLCF